MYYALCTLHYALCTLHYALCTTYALCTLHYALCNIPWQAPAQNSLSHNATHWYEVLHNLPPNLVVMLHKYIESSNALTESCSGSWPGQGKIPPYILSLHFCICLCLSLYSCTYNYLFVFVLVSHVPSTCFIESPGRVLICIFYTYFTSYWYYMMHSVAFRESRAGSRAWGGFCICICICISYVFHEILIWCTAMRLQRVVRVFEPGEGCPLLSCRLTL